MGKGDKKSKKGKRWKGSYGNARKRTAIKAKVKRNISLKPVAADVAVQEVEVKPKAKRTTKKKAEAGE